MAETHEEFDVFLTMVPVGVTPTRRSQSGSRATPRGAPWDRFTLAEAIEQHSHGGPLTGPDRTAVRRLYYLPPVRGTKRLGSLRPSVRSDSVGRCRGRVGVSGSVAAFGATGGSCSSSTGRSVIRESSYASSGTRSATVRRTGAASRRGSSAHGRVALAGLAEERGSAASPTRRRTRSTAW